MWDAVAKPKEWVKNPEPGSRGTWASYADAETAPRKHKAKLGAHIHGGGIPVVRQRARISFATTPPTGRRLWRARRTLATQSVATVGGKLRMIATHGRSWAERMGLMRLRCGGATVTATAASITAPAVLSHLPRNVFSPLSILHGSPIRRILPDGS